MPRTASTRTSGQTRQPHARSRVAPAHPSGPAAPILFRLPEVQLPCGLEPVDEDLPESTLESEGGTLPTCGTSKTASSPAVAVSPSYESAQAASRSVDTSVIGTASPAAEPARSTTTATVADDDSGRSWWEHWSSGVVLILLIIALVTGSILAFNDSKNGSADLLADDELSDEFTLDSITVPELDFRSATVADASSLVSGPDTQVNAPGASTKATEELTLAVSVPESSVAAPPAVVAENQSNTPSIPKIELPSAPASEAGQGFIPPLGLAQQPTSQNPSSVVAATPQNVGIPENDAGNQGGLSLSPAFNNGGAESQLTGTLPDSGRASGIPAALVPAISSAGSNASPSNQVTSGLDSLIPTDMLIETNQPRIQPPTFADLSSEAASVNAMQTNATQTATNQAVGGGWVQQPAGAPTTGSNNSNAQTLVDTKQPEYAALLGGRQPSGPFSTPSHTNTGAGGTNAQTVAHASADPSSAESAVSVQRLVTTANPESDAEALIRQYQEYRAMVEPNPKSPNRYVSPSSGGSSAGGQAGPSQPVQYQTDLGPAVGVPTLPQPPLSFPANGTLQP